MGVRGRYTHFLCIPEFWAKSEGAVKNESSFFHSPLNPAASGFIHIKSN